MKTQLKIHVNILRNRHVNSRNILLSRQVNSRGNSCKNTKLSHLSLLVYFGVCLHVFKNWLAILEIIFWNILVENPTRMGANPGGATGAIAPPRICHKQL